MATKLWTEEATTLLKQMVREGYSGGMIAARLGVSRNSVVGKVMRLGLHLGTSRKGMGISAAYGLRKPHQNPLKKRKSITAKPQIQFQKAPIPPPNPEDIARKTFSELSENDCRYPIGDPLSPEFGFCGSEKMPGSSYCSGHHSRCWVGIPAKKPRKPSEDRETTRVMADA